jgi:hypothetical protein
MKRLAVVAAVLVIAGCKAKEENATTSDTTAAPAMAPAPAPTADTGMKHDTGMMKMDTGMKSDTSMKKSDTGMKKTKKTP